MHAVSCTILRHDPHSGLQAYANEKAIKIVGDMPIYVGGQSADVWAYQDLFELSETGSIKRSSRPSLIGGNAP